MGRCIYLRKGEVHTPPVVGVKAGDLPIGQIVKLMEGGVATEFIVVNQGIPENSSLYDASCNGTWLLRKDIKENRVWNNTDDNTYSTSTITAWLNGEYFNGLGTIEQKAVKQVKIPYVNGTGSGGSVASGANGLSVKAFLVGGYEVGFTTIISSSFPVDGAKLSYFESGNGASANNKRRAFLNDLSVKWWTRSSGKTGIDEAWNVFTDGNANAGYVSGTLGIRPCLIIPSTSIFDGKTYTLLGGASDPPPPLNIYSIGQSALSNVTNFSAEESEGGYTEISFSPDGLALISKYGSAESTVGFKLSSTFISDYKTLVVKVGYTDAKGTPKKAVIGWGNGNYYYNLRYYTPEQYSNYGTTSYAETSFIGADSISNPTEYRIDISTVTNNAADYTIAMAFTGSGDSATTWGCYALITDIHLE